MEQNHNIPTSNIFLKNRLYFGDCLDVLREDIQDKSIDLIYLDPPFNSKRLYNAFIGDAQWVAFDDTWRWSEAIDDFVEVAADVSIANTMEGLKKILGGGAELAYLSYMANRLRECKRVLKDNGSIYLHCDPTMSHYLKILMDGIFEYNFVNEIIWSYKTGGVGKKWFAKKHDIILFYSKGKNYTFNQLKQKSYLDDSKWKEHHRGASELGFKRDEQGMYRMVSCRDTWDDLKPLHPRDSRRIYPTQKPVELIQRIINASSKENDVILDPFCGCGTTIEAAESMQRSWIGIDICVNACKAIEKRITDTFPTLLWGQVEFIGLPKIYDDAKILAGLDKFKFERWAASLVDGIEANKKQCGDGGIDGRGRIAIKKGQFIDIVSQVKGGYTKPGDIQAFNGARLQADADLGIFTCFQEQVTQGMKDTAASAGHFMGVPVIQIYTIEDYFENRKPKMPYLY